MSTLAKKLLMKPGTRWLIHNTPANYPAIIELPEGVETSTLADGAFDGIQLFTKDSTELAAALAYIYPAYKPETVLWICYPKKSSGIPTDLQMTASWDEAGKYGLRPVASAAVDDIWTALRFRPENLVKKSASRNDVVKQNYPEYIDPDKKLVKLPPDAMEALLAEPVALHNFEKLAYSHKKEYVVWILSAKQQQTRERRLEKMAEMLFANKKIPSE